MRRFQTVLVQSLLGPSSLAVLTWTLFSPSRATAGDSSELRTVPFPPGTFVASVAWPVPPTVEQQADRFVVELPAEHDPPVTCVVTATGDLGLRSALTLARHGGELPDLSHATVADVAVAPHLPMIFMTVRRSNDNAIRLAAFRDPRTSFACLLDGGGDPQAFQRAVTEIATSIHPARPTRGTKLVRFCRMSLNDGSVGFERWQVDELGGARSSIVNSSLAFRRGDGVNFMELDASEESDSTGTIGHATMVRAFGGTPQMRSTIHRRQGPSYEYELETPEGPLSGRFRTKKSSGLPGAVAIAERIKHELLGGRGQTFFVEIWDPFSPPREASEMMYSLESRTPPIIEVTQGPRHSRQLVDKDGLVQHAETALLSSVQLVSECETQRRAR
jgi:hypothetical protein